MIQHECSGTWFFKAGEYLPATLFDTRLLQTGSSFYEVLRIINGKPLFLDDHIKRLKKSAGAMLFEREIQKFDMAATIRQLAEKNSKTDGNIKILLSVFPLPVLSIYFVFHKYPSPEQYRQGVGLTLLKAERPDPGIKAVNLELRVAAETILKDPSLYEVLLVNQAGEITEGHKSNIFFIQGDQVVTPPEHMVLPGITRNYVVTLCRENYIDIEEKPLHQNMLTSFNCAFITGTSPKVMPVSNIDDVTYDVGHATLRKIMGLYDQLIVESIVK